ncbi:MAG: hypothetical protein CL578_23785 [Alteromonadaceae bacterium]|uniref:DUF2971 domain-containing protein n=1 Tax=Paraglaciecola chathamensis TaxID=368405 RepID=UPI000C3D5FCB|nr:DUF2971 domain-containing protein [Paraglaciecola agarilytica]MBN28041.1 hypothetical protein [Alteromonadaceae bacterium]
MLYKYRTLDNFQFVLDIIVNQRLFTATFENMNDPMEGYYTADPDIPESSIDALREHHKSLRFCSSSKYHNNPLMWAHYANGNRGIAIGFETKKGTEFREIIYGSHSHLVSSKPTTIERAKDVLCFKAGFWRYEDEVRIFVDTEDKNIKGNYVYVSVKEVIFGERADRSQKALLKSIVRKVDPKIKIIEWDHTMHYAYSEPIFNIDSDRDKG